MSGDGFGVYGKEHQFLVNWHGGGVYGEEG